MQTEKPSGLTYSTSSTNLLLAIFVDVYNLETVFRILRSMYPYVLSCEYKRWLIMKRMKWRERNRPYRCIIRLPMHTNAHKYQLQITICIPPNSQKITMYNPLDQMNKVLGLFCISNEFLEAN